MQEKLIIYLHANDLTHPGWAVTDSEGGVSQSAYRDNAEGLAAIAEGKEVWVWVPAEDVLLVSIKLPKMSRARLIQALPFALEEQLIADVDTLHFAPGYHHAENDLPVMIVAHEKMQHWLSVLQAWNIQPDHLLPLVYALPYVENDWYLAMNEMAVVRSGLFQGFACDKTNLHALLDLNLEAAAHLPQRIEVKNYTSQPFHLPLDIPVTIREENSQPDQWISDLAGQCANAPALTLLQGKYALKKANLPRVEKIGKALRYAAVAWIVLLFLTPLISYFILRQRVSSIDNQIAQIYKRNFPQASNVVAPKLRMEEKLRKTSAQMGESRLLSLLGFVGKGMLETPSVKLKRFDFQSNQLTLELTAASSEDFSAFTDFLVRQGLNVKQKNANLTGEKVNATLEIES